VTLRTYPVYPGLKPTTSRTPIWKTIVKEATSGRELRLGRQAYPRWQYSLSYEFLRDRAALPELQGLLAFYNLCNGQAIEFLYVDADGAPVVDPDTSSVIGTTYSAVANQAFGTGDGSTTFFQLARQLAGGTNQFVEPVWAPTGTPKIKNNGTLLTAGVDYTLSDTGLVQMLAVPAVGRVLTWTGTYAMRCRFTADSVEFKRMVLGLHEAPKVEFISTL
jgi:uncharacterized protein (TIGR02217 family)